MTERPDFKLISFTICPFVQRARVLLNMKQIPYQIEYIDLENKPNWFLDRVPTGKVPALFIGEETLFESAIINEYLDEVSPGSLLPTDPLERAKTRAWIALSDTLIFAQYRALIASDAEAFEDELTALIDGLAQFADLADSRSMASDPTLLDAALVPVFTRIAELPNMEARIRHELRHVPQIQAWSDHLLASSAVKGSVADEFSADFVAYFEKRSSHALQVEKEFEHA